MPKRMRNRLGPLVMVLLFWACIPTLPYRHYIDLSTPWEASAPLSFELPPLNGNFDMYIHLRNDNHYLFSNIFLIAQWYQNDTLVATDTLEYAMSAPDGSWLGKGFTEVKESKLYWKEGVALSDSLRYRVQITHALRAQGEVSGIEALPGILSVGLAVENSK